MRTITKGMYNRLQFQAQEAETIGLKKIASNLKDQIIIYKDNLRKNGDFYRYSADDMKNDVENFLWDPVVRIADYFGKNFDAVVVNNIIEKFAEELIDEIRVAIGSEDGVGAYEENVPGQEIEVEAE